MKKKETYISYQNEEYQATNEEEFIYSIQNYIEAEKKNIDTLVGEMNIATFSTESEYYFIFHIDVDVTITLVAPLGSFGLHIKNIEQFKDTLLDKLL